MIDKIAGICQWEGCGLAATNIASGRDSYGTGDKHPEPGLYCDRHAEAVIDEGSPEYHAVCPNCDCRFGLN